MDVDSIVRLYSRLTSLKANLPTVHDIKENYIEEYHNIVDELSEAAECPLEEFKVPSDQIKKRKSFVTPKESFYTKEKYCERTLVLSKMDALISYFSIKLNSNEEKGVGFRPPKKD